MSNPTAGSRQHPDLRAALIELGSPQSVQRNQRIAEQAARDAVAMYLRRTPMTLTPVPETTSGAG